MYKKFKRTIYESLNKVLIFFVIVVNHPILRSIDVWFSILLKFSFLNKGLFSLGSWAFLPFSWISLSVHDNSFSFSNDSVITASNLGSGHLGDSNSDGLTFSWHNDDFSSDINVIIISQDTRNHKFGTIADGVNWWILNDNSWVFS